LAAHGLAWVLSDIEDESGLITVVHCLNNSVSGHASGEEPKTSEPCDAGHPNSGTQDGQEETGSPRSEDDDVLQLPQFMVPCHITHVLAPYLVGDEVADPHEVIQHCLSRRLLSEDDVDIAYEALLTCVNLGLLVVEDVKRR
jgi:hypothetical protein